MLRKIWLRFCVLVCCICLITPCLNGIVYASSFLYGGGFAINYVKGNSTLHFDQTYFIYDSTSPVYCYIVITRCPDGKFENNFLLISKDSFSYSRWGLNSSSHVDSYDYIIPSNIDSLSKLKSSLDGGYHVNFTLSNPSSGTYDSFGPYFTGGALPVFYITRDSGDTPFYLQDDFILGEDPSGGDSSSIIYDSSIPAPENLKFEERSKSFGFLTGSKFEHCLTWSNGLASPPLNVRISAVADCMYNDTGQSVPDSMLELLSASPTGVKADTGTFVATADDIKSKILDGTTLVSMLEYRVQFYRYDADGKLCVGPVSTVHLNYNKLGKYIGYTVTTDRPKDESNIGQSGGMDDYYQNNWTSDGENYDEYDKNGNLIDSGKSEDKGNILQRLINSLVNIPTVINEFFKGIQSLMTGIGEFPALLSRLFAFLPAELIALVGLGISLVIVLRILGR